MEAATVQQPEKFLVRNNTAGYVGVIEIDHRGEEHGVNIEPHGARWMTEQEMVATARAPRDPRDNPFEETSYFAQDPETGRQVEVKVRPLSLEQDSSRFVPSNDRYVPTQDAPQGASPAVAQEAATTEGPSAAPPSTGSSAGPPEPAPPAPAAPQDAPVPALRQERAAAPATESPTALTGSQTPTGGDRDEGESWVQPPEAPGQVISGSLAGDDSAPAGEEAEAAPDPTDHPGEREVPSVVAAQAAPQTPGAVEEEHAREVDQEVGEETGQARPPAQDAPEGEFASREEVGSPDAPEQSGDDETLIGG